MGGGLDEIKAISAPSWDWAWAWAELGNYRYFCRKYGLFGQLPLFCFVSQKMWLSVFGSDREFSVRLLRFSVRSLKIEIFTENCVISEVAITALSQKIC